MKYDAITLDTSIFDQYGLKLERGLLKKLEQFRGMPCGLIISEIVLHELNSHLKKRIVDARGQLERALVDCREYLSIDDEKLKEAQDNIVPKKSNEELARITIKNFLERTGAETINAAPYVNVADLIARYFGAAAPFSESGKKKNEFPDAIALVSLEAYAKKKNIKILAVSTDNDWVEFGKGSDWIDVETDFAKGLSKFQPQEIVFAFCKRLGLELLSGEAEKVSDSLELLLAEKVSEMVVYPDADSTFFWDTDYVEIEYNSFELQTDEEDRPCVYAVQVQEGALSIEMKVRIEASASCEFSLSVYDSSDSDNVSMGTAAKTVDFDFETGLLVTFVGSLQGEIADIKVESVEVLAPIRTVEFGELVPDWW